jgi:hypothetical protein
MLWPGEDVLLGRGDVEGAILKEDGHIEAILNGGGHIEGERLY